MIFFKHILLTFTILNVADWFNPFTSAATVKEMRTICKGMVMFTGYKGITFTYVKINLGSGPAARIKVMKFPFGTQIKTTDGVDRVITKITLPTDIEIEHDSFTKLQENIIISNGVIHLASDDATTESMGLIKINDIYLLLKGVELSDDKITLPQANINILPNITLSSASRDILQFITYVKTQFRIGQDKRIDMVEAITTLKNEYTKYLVKRYFSTMGYLNNPLNSYCTSTIKSGSTKLFDLLNN